MQFLFCFVLPSGASKCERIPRKPQKQKKLHISNLSHIITTVTPHTTVARKWIQVRNRSGSRLKCLEEWEWGQDHDMFPNYISISISPSGIKDISYFLFVYVALGLTAIYSHEKNVNFLGISEPICCAYSCSRDHCQNILSALLPNIIDGNIVGFLVVHCYRMRLRRTWCKSKLGHKRFLL